MFGFFKRRRPAPLPIQALAAIVLPAPEAEYTPADRADSLPRRRSQLHFGAGASAANEDEAFVMAFGALEQHGPHAAVAVLEGYKSVRDCRADAIPDREQIVQDPSAPYDDVEMEAFAPGSLADQAEAFLANRAGGAA